MHIKPIAYTVVGILFFLARIIQESRKHLSPTNNDDSTVNIIHTECFYNAYEMKYFKMFISKPCSLDIKKQIVCGCSFDAWVSSVMVYLKVIFFGNRTKCDTVNN